MGKATGDATELLEKTDVVLINEETIREKVYLIRGQKVMLDYELAEIYGYTTSRFNEQVKNNIEKFDDDFMFRLTKEEMDYLMSKKSISSWGGRRKPPRVFTEQGIYMLMTILRGDLATRQSKALIRTFKKMKDYILDNQDVVSQRDYLHLALHVDDHTRQLGEMNVFLNKLDNAVAEIMDQLRETEMYHPMIDELLKTSKLELSRG